MILKPLIRKRFFALACAVSMVGMATTAVEAKPSATVTYANDPNYACGPNGKSLEWYQKGVPFPCPTAIPASAQRELYHDFMRRAWVDGDLSVLDKYVDPNTYDYSPLHGPEKGTKGFAGIISAFRASLSDIKLQHSDMVEGDLVTHFWKLSGVHNKAPLFGAPASGKTIVLSGISAVEVKNGKVAGRWSQLDIFGLLVQLGLAKPLP
jgi:predicted ester cyclase